MAFKIKRFIPASPLRNDVTPRFKVNLGKVKSQATKDGEAGYEADDKARKNKTGIYAPKQKTPRKKVTLKKFKAAKINIGDQKGIGEKDVLDSTPKISTKKPTKKTAPKDNSRKAIRKRKKADKAAGVSKSQMRANKAKSKSEAALEKAKKSKNPDYKAQLKRKSDRLAKRAERKGGSPVKAVGDPKDPKDPKKKYGKVTVKKDKNEYGSNRITVSQPYTTTTSGKKTNKSYKQLAKEGGDVAAAKKFNKNKTSSGVRTRTMLYGDAKPVGPKISVSTPKPKIDLSKKPTKPSNITVGPSIPGGKKKPPKIKKAKSKRIHIRKPSGRGRVTGCN